MIQGNYDAIRERCENGTATNEDVAALLADNDNYAEKLTDCWVVLDMVARAETTKPLHGHVHALLRAQQVPGWKPGQ